MLTSIVIEMVPSSASVVAAFLLFGFLNAGTPLLIASTPVSAAHPDENARRSRNAAAIPLEHRARTGPRPRCRGRRFGRPADARTASRPKPQTAIPRMAAMKMYVGIANAAPDSRTPRRFMRGQEQHCDHGRGHLVPVQRTGCADGGVLRGRRDRHRDGEDVVDHQRAGHRQAGGRAEVHGGDLVVTAAGRVGVHVLPVRRRRRSASRRRPAGRSSRRTCSAASPASDSVRKISSGRVGDRRQRVTGEDREGDALRQQRLAQLRAAQLASDAAAVCRCRLERGSHR